MIIPTPEFDPLFAADGVPFRQKMIEYIEQQFPDVLSNGGDLSNAVRALKTEPAHGLLQANSQSDRRAA